MAYDEGQAQILRDELAGDGVTEKRMFGGLAFLLNGHMVCGVHKGGAMVRVGKAEYDLALSVEGVTPMMFTGRPMAGMVDVSADCLADDARRARLMVMALRCMRALPPKVAKARKG